MVREILGNGEELICAMCATKLKEREQMLKDHMEGLYAYENPESGEEDGSSQQKT